MEKYKSTIRIPTEQYAYVEIVFEGTPEEISDAKHKFTNLLRPKAGLIPKAFNDSLDRYLTENKLEAEMYEEMNLDQQEIIQSIKRSLKRINK